MRNWRFTVTSWLFTRLLGIVYFFAFQSIACQVIGLVGADGISPAHLFLDTIKGQLGNERFWLFPSIFWLNCSDLTLQLVCWMGCLLSLLVVADIFAGPSLFCLWGLYLSVVTIGQDFLSFQWDILLLEAGFLAPFLLPWRTTMLWSLEETQCVEPSRFILWMLRILIFKLMLQSGLVKLLSGDPTWATRTALDYHYFTQPLPTPLAYYAAQFPSSFNKLCCTIMLTTELVVPFAIFFGRWGRTFAAAVFITLQIVILLTGNYAFFNWLTIALSLTLLDDRILAKFLPGSLTVAYRIGRGLRNTAQPNLRIGWRPVSIFAVGGITAFLTAVHLTGYASVSPSLAAAMRVCSGFYLVNSYGLFAVMTTERDEIIVEGSMDGEHWLPYDFKYKPGKPNVAPPIVAPYQPRLDWQMWFASLGTYENNPWFTNFLVRLMQGKKEVLNLLATNPFPQSPPKYVRAEFYKYTFSQPSQLSENGNWWKREFIRYYLPPISIDERLE